MNLTGKERLLVQIYDAETGGKLPVTNPGLGAAAEDGVTLILPFDPATTERRKYFDTAQYKYHGENQARFAVVETAGRFPPGFTTLRTLR